MRPALPPVVEPSAASGRLCAWQRFAWRGLRNQFLCLAIALLIWLLGDDRTRFVNAWIYSAAIGTCCWFFIDGSRIMLAIALARDSRWPGAPWMLACILAGTLAGYSLGTSIGDTVTGLHTPSLLHNTTALAISLIAAIGATYYFIASERLREEQAAAEAARRLATESQLKLLESQLEPHMLFNTLANLRVLIASDPPRAQAMLDRLIGFLRATLGGSRSAVQPLAAEFDRLSDYLALMAVRMGPRLAVQFDLPASLRAIPVPPLLLQPLVENAIRHGLEPQLDGGRVSIAARAEGGELVLEVSDTGAGRPPAAPAGPGGHGTALVRERLAALYGARARFSLHDAAGGGTLARVTLPLPATAGNAAGKAATVAA